MATGSPSETILHLGKEGNIIHQVACHQGETWQRNTGLFLEPSCRCLGRGQVHHKGEAKSLHPSAFPTTHQNLLSHLYLAFKLDFANTCTKVWVWIEGALDGFHWPSLLRSCLLPANDGCWLRRPSQWAQMSSGQYCLSLLHMF